MKKVNIVAEIPAYLRDALAQLPQSAGKSESDIIADALRDYVDAHVPRMRELKELDWRALQQEDLKVAIASAAEGDFASAEEVKAFFARQDG